MSFLQGVGKPHCLWDVLVAAVGVKDAKAAVVFLENIALSIMDVQDAQAALFFFGNITLSIMDVQDFIVGTQAHIGVFIIALHVRTPTALYHSIQLL